MFLDASALALKRRPHPEPLPEYRESEEMGPHAPGRRVRVLHVINSFDYGGAEAMLCNLLLRCDRSRFRPYVAALIDDMKLAGPVLEAGVPVVHVGMKPGVPDLRGVMRLARHVRRIRPDVVQCWMDHSNLVGGVASRLASRAAVVWGVHHSDHRAVAPKRSTLLTVRACAALSRHLPARVVCCSEHGRDLYRAGGFAASKLQVIPNGFDLDRFRPDPAARAQVRREVGIPQHTPLVGLIARYDPLKDHATFLRAAGLLARRRADVNFLLCGTRVDSKNAAMMSLVRAEGLLGRCHLLGPRSDVPRITAALDVASSSSVSEAFPLVVGEAMACGVPVVATDVGDCARMIGPFGHVVAPRDPAAMASAWGKVLDLAPAERAALGTAARQRVLDNFELTNVVRRYEALYWTLAARRASDPVPAAREAEKSPENHRHAVPGCAAS